MNWKSYIATLLLGIILSGLLFHGPSRAAVCQAAFPAPEAIRPPEKADRAPCADALLSILFKRLPPAPGMEIHVVDTRYARSRTGEDNAFIAFQPVIAPIGR